jgi:DNA primase
MPSTISDYTIKAVKEIPITTLLERESIECKRAGKEALTLCPWHNDKNPSLTINDEKGFCYCFVCQSGSDGIGFIQEKLGLSFADAVIRLANSNDIEVIYEDLNPELALKEARRRVELMNQLTREHESYRRYIKDPRAQRIRDFLDSRNIDPGTSKYFEIGYCPRGFFGDRITIPIHDHRGTLVGFSGRATRDGTKPKYKNSENNDYFDKSKIVFNEHRAAIYAKEADCLIFVEGHLDVVALWQYGIKNVVALQGTATPSESILNRLSKRTKRFILCFDADSGGSYATEQFIKVAGPIACRGDLTISVAIMPDGYDPDDCIKNNVDFFSIIESAKPWLDWQLDVWLANVDRTDTARFTQIEANVKTLVESIQSPVLRQYYIDKASTILSNDPIAAAKIAKKWAENTSSIKTKKKWTRPTPMETRSMAERRLLRLYIHFPELRDELREWMAKVQSPAHRWLWQRIVEIENHYKGLDIINIIVAVYCMAEPHYVRQLRPVSRPTIKVTKNEGIMNHIKHILSQELIINDI